MKPAIYIGLGGTGIQAISYTKKMYEDAYGVGNIPPHIAFLAWDYDHYACNSHSLATSMEAEATPLHDIGNPREYFIIQKENGAFGWMFENNSQFLKSNIPMSPPPVRTTGRYYTEFFKDSIERTIQAKWQQVTNAMHMHAGVQPCIDVHIVTSLCGGAGAGSFINVAEMIQRNFSNHANIIGHGVMHGIIRAMNPTGHIAPYAEINAYSSILDLDYLMSANVNNPITFEINGVERTFTQPIFHEFFVIDNTTANGNVISSVDALCEAIGTYLYASNFNTTPHPVWAKNIFDVIDKKGWVQSFGAYQVVYKGDELADLYARSYASCLIKKMCSEDGYTHHSTVKWAESVGLREDGKYYCRLIDSILDTEQIVHHRYPATDITAPTEATKSIIYRYVDDMHEFPLQERIALLKAEKRDLIDRRIEDMLREGKVAGTRQFLYSLRDILDMSACEIQNQIYYCMEKKDRFLRELDANWHEYERAHNGILFLLLRNRCQQILDEVNRIAKDCLKVAYEIGRRGAAVEILTSLFDYVTARLEESDRLIDRLNELCHRYGMKIYECKSCRYDAPPFEYDLSITERIEMHVKENDVDIPAFCFTLEKSLLEMNIEHEFEATIYNFAISRPRAVEYRTKRLIDVINELSDNDFAQLAYAINSKCDRLLRINDRAINNECGEKPSSIIINEYAFSLYCNAHETRRLQSVGNFIHSGNGSTSYQFIPNNLGQLHQKMFVTRKDTAIIPYCINSLDDTVLDCYYKLVKNSSSGQTGFNPHFDKLLFVKMRSEGFKLKPWCPDSAEESPNT